MARDSGHQPREENPHQGPSHSFGRPSSAESERRDASEHADRERAIETGREGREGGRHAPGTMRPGALSSALAVGLSPFSLMRRMADDMDRLFQDVGLARAPSGMSSLGSLFDRDVLRAGPGAEALGWAPQVEAFRRGDRFVVRADLPGLRKDDVTVEVQDNVLAISGERRFDHEEDRNDVYRSERAYGKFFRAISLPDDVKSEECEAEFRDGVLEVSFAGQRETERRARRVPIR